MTVHETAKYWIKKNSVHLSHLSSISKRDMRTEVIVFTFSVPYMSPINGMVLLTVNRLEASLESFAMDRASHEGSREA